MRRPENSEYSPFYEGYVSSITETDVLSVLAAQPDVDWDDGFERALSIE